MAQLTLVIGNKNYSSWSLRPWLALQQFGIEFAEVRIALYQEDAAAKIRRYSPSGKVPALIDGDTTIWDSLAICEYVAEVFPHLPWWGEDRKTRAIARSVSAEMHSSFQNLRSNMSMNIRDRFPGKGLTLEVQQDIDRILSIWQTCRREFGGNGAFLFGNFTIADAFYAPVVTRFVTYGVEIDPISQAYSEAVLALPAMQAWSAAAIAEPERISAFHP